MLREKKKIYLSILVFFLCCNDKFFFLWFWGDKLKSREKRERERLSFLQPTKQTKHLWHNHKDFEKNIYKLISVLLFCRTKIKIVFLNYYRKQLQITYKINTHKYLQTLYFVNTTHTNTAHKVQLNHLVLCNSFTFINLLFVVNQNQKK